MQIMQCSKISVTVSRAFRRAATMALANLLLAAAVSANPVAEPASGQIIAGSSTEPYGLDPGFHDGDWIVDDFAANLAAPNTGFVGRKIARLPGGDYVVAALVKKPDGTQTNNYWNLGLVRYNSDGSQRLTWSSPTTMYAHYQNQYVIYPNIASGVFTTINDLKVIDGKILVFADLFRGNYNEAVILVFGTDGSFKQQVSPFFFNPGPGIGDTNDYAGGMAVRVDLVTSRYYVMVAGTLFRPATGHGRGVFRRYELLDSGMLSAATNMIDLNTSACWSTSWECHARGLAMQSIYSQHAYVTYAMRPNTTTGNWNVVVSRINFDGQGDSSWDPNNVSWDISDGGDHSDWPVGLLVRTPPSSGAFRDEIYVVTESARNCQPGVGLLRFNHDGGITNSRLFGGATETGPACSGNSRPFHKPQGIAANATNAHSIDTRIAVVGYRGTSFVNDGRPRALLRVLDASLNTLDEHELTYPIGADTLGTRYPAFWGVVGDEAGFTMTGSLLYPSVQPTDPALRGKSSTAAIRFTRDVLFADGFE